MRQSLRSLGVRPSVRFGGVLAALVVATLVSAPSAQAQSRAKVSIDFPFVAGGNVMEAGNYVIEASREKVVLQSASGKGASVVMSVITRLGRHDADAEAELYLDKVGGKLLLSEFWFPNVDGFLVLNTPVDHDHRVLGGSAPHK